MSTREDPSQTLILASTSRTSHTEPLPSRSTSLLEEELEVLASNRAAGEVSLNREAGEVSLNKEVGEANSKVVGVNSLNKEVGVNSLSMADGVNSLSMADGVNNPDKVAGDSSTLNRVVGEASNREAGADKF